MSRVLTHREISPRRPWRPMKFGCAGVDRRPNCRGARGAQPGFAPRPTTEQYIMEYVIRSGNQRVKDVLHYLSNPPDFFNLYKILEVITKDLGKRSKNKGFTLIKKRGWATKKDLDAFNNTANNVHRHWKENRPAPEMNLQEAVLMSRRIIRKWIEELAGLQ